MHSKNIGCFHYTSSAFNTLVQVSQLTLGMVDSVTCDMFGMSCCGCEVSISILVFVRD